MIVTSKQVRFTVAEFMRLYEAGVFGDRRVELLDGRIVEMNAQGDDHVATVTRMMILLSRHFGDMNRFFLVVQGTYVIEPYDAPDPDFSVYDAAVGTPSSERPTPFVVMEVSKKSLRRDVGVKMRRYAAAGVRDYWVINLVDRRIEIYRDPVNRTGLKTDWEYQNVTHYAAGDAPSLLAYPQISIPVSDILP